MWVKCRHMATWGVHWSSTLVCFLFQSLKHTQTHTHTHTHTHTPTEGLLNARRETCSAQIQKETQRGSSVALWDVCCPASAAATRPPPGSLMEHDMVLSLSHARSLEECVGGDRTLPLVGKYYLPFFYSRWIILGNSMCSLCAQEKF